MKKILLAILVALPMLAVAQSPKFGVVNTDAVMEAMPDVKTVGEQIDAATKKYEDDFQNLRRFNPRINQTAPSAGDSGALSEV